MTTPRLRRLAGLAVVSTLALSGCGLANPGVAARVGDDTITVRDVNEESDLICQAVEKDLQDPLPMSLARYQILTGQISRAIATQIAEEYDVSPGSDYTSAVAAAEVQVAAYPEETRDTLLTVTTTQTYVESILAEASQEAARGGGPDRPDPGRDHRPQPGALRHLARLTPPRHRPAVRVRVRRRRLHERGHRCLGRGERHRQGRSGRGARPGGHRAASRVSALRLSIAP